MHEPTLIGAPILGCTECGRLLQAEHTLTCPHRAAGWTTVHRHHARIHGWQAGTTPPEAETLQLFEPASTTPRDL